MSYPKPMLMLSAMACLLAACGGGSSGSSGNAAPVAQAPAPSPSPSPSATQTPQAGTWQLVWADEFNTASIDTTRWKLIEDCWGGGNDERQCYTARPENARIENGNLVIVAREEQWTGDAWPDHLKPHVPDPDARKMQEFTSARLTTQGKHDWRYGRIEMRARLPQGQGTWPAFWMLPEEEVYGTWAASGEIDILEVINLGVNCQDCPAGGESRIYGSLHYGGQYPDNAFVNRQHVAPDILNGGFHVYGMIWEEGRFTWTLDGVPYGTIAADEWFTTASSKANAPFDEKFHLIVNLAIGGRWPEGNGVGGISRVNFPKSMEIDWIRVYECDADPVTGRGCS